MKTPIISLISIFLLSVILYGCKDTDNLVYSVNQHIKMNHIILDKDLSVCLIIPEVGCGECIAGGVYFLLENQDKFKITQKKHKVVFTALNSKKMLLRTLQIDSIDSLYHELDTKGRYLLHGELGLYPVVLYLNQGKVIAVDIQSPNNTGTLHSLNKILNRNL